ncbi:hypothetical protein TNCV_2592211 [Trichonephila clavipes]|nr:hypothetical protein TNCV_2592211 [Trichonephila clavipes]
MSHCSATRGLLATDHVILYHGQVTWTTPELASSSPNYHTTPQEDVSALDRFNVHHCPTREVDRETKTESIPAQSTSEETATVGIKSILLERPYTSHTTQLPHI